MIEIQLEEFEHFYKERVNAKFYKLKKVTKKLITDIRECLIQIKICMDRFLDSGKEKVEEKSLRSLNFFSERIKKEIDDIEIPEEIYYDNISNLLNSIKKLFNSINEISRKSLPKFHKDVQPEIKELNYLTRKLGKSQGRLDLFLRRKYMEVKTAEDILKKLPKLFTLKDNIENAKADLDNFEAEIKEREENLEQLSKELLELEKNDLFKRYEKEKDALFKLKIKINEQLGFKKALKKLRVELEKENLHIPNVDLRYLKEFLKNPVNVLIKEPKDLPKFSSLLVQLRHILEENKLNLKSDKKEKTIEQINEIFKNKLIHNHIQKLKEFQGKIKQIEKEIQNSGLAKKLDEIKNLVSINTAKLEHVKSDKTRKNKDYLRYLGNLKNEREEFQNTIEDVLGDQIKIIITFNF
ncbi:MAG: hypothetical protein ACTSQJ_13980 [Promethearchaeota archaeon]